MNLKKQIAEHKGTLPELEIDSDTGLPKLPEGFAWRVEKYGYGKYLRVDLVAKKVTSYNFLEKVFFGEKDREEWEDYGHDLATDSGLTSTLEKSEILVEATRIYTELKERLDNKHVASDLEGIYPPKSIL